jgi:hypothetical protein
MNSKTAKHTMQNMLEKQVYHELTSKSVKHLTKH